MLGSGYRVDENRYNVSFSMIIPGVDENTRILSLCPYENGQYKLEECVTFILPSNTK